MNIQEALEKVTGLLPGAEKVKQLESEVENLKTRAQDAERKAASVGNDLAGAQTEIADLKAQLEAKEKDVERRAGLKGAEIAAGRGLERPVKDEANPGGKGKKDAKALLEEYNAIEDPKTAAAFYREHFAAMTNSGI